MFQLTIVLGTIAIAGLVAGCVLAVTGYSSAGPFAISSACVGVIGTLVAQDRVEHWNHKDE